MDLNLSLFQGDKVRLGSLDYERDAPVESGWTHDHQYLRLLSPDLARPLSPSQVRKKYEQIEKEVDEKRNLFYFAIRSAQSAAGEPDRLIGFVRLYRIAWAHRGGQVQLGIGDPADRGQGYGREALALILRYAFNEINLHRLAALVPEYNEAAIGLFTQAGFTEEVRRRQALQREGAHWDLLHLGLMAADWRGRQAKLAQPTTETANDLA